MSGFDYLKKPKVSAAANFMLQSQNGQRQMAEVEAKLRADGFTQTGPDEWAKTVEPNPSNLTKALDTLLHLDEPKEIFIGYQDAANYVLLAGPYKEAELSAFAMGKAWGRFQKDTSLFMSFPIDKREYARLTTFSVPATAKRKGAYGKL